MANRQQMPQSYLPSSRRYSLHQIRNEQFKFSPHQFSRFKWGDESAAEELGRALATGFIQAKLENNPVVPELTAAVSYERVPTAAFYLRKYFVRQLNQWLLSHGHAACEEVHIKRKTSFYRDFGLMSAKERARHMSNDYFEVDTELLVGKTLLILDDIRITGAHERRLLQMLHDMNITNETFVVYYAELCNPHIDPTIENRLNFYAVRNLDEMASLAQCSTFAINARFVKHVLSQDSVGFMKFMSVQDDQFLNLFARAARANGYWRVDKYISNLYGLEEMRASFSLHNDVISIAACA
jgi:hypothetical protein